MKVAVVAAFVAGYDVGLESSYIRALEADGHETVRISLAPPEHEKPWPRGLSQLQELGGYARHQSALRREVIAASPDLVLIIKGRGVFGETVRAWRRQGLPVFNLFPDNPFEGAKVGLAARSLTAQYRAVDRMFVHDRFAVGQLRQLGIRAEFIAFARDPFIHRAAGPSGQGPDPIVFVGNPDAERIRYLRAVADLGLGLYGQWDWARLPPGDPLLACVRGGVQLGAAMVRSLRSAQISLNVLRRCQKTAHNMRSFESPASGVCTLSEASIGVQELFEAERELVLFRDPSELRAAALRLMAAPQLSRDIAQAGQARVEHETYAVRARELLSYL